MHWNRGYIDSISFKSDTNKCFPLATWLWPCHARYAHRNSKFCSLLRSHKAWYLCILSVPNYVVLSSTKAKETNLVHFKFSIRIRRKSLCFIKVVSSFRSSVTHTNMASPLHLNNTITFKKAQEQYNIAFNFESPLFSLVNKSITSGTDACY